MSQTAEAQGLQVSCALPNCHWKGSPADAPTHDCPTPEHGVAYPAAEDHPFAGMLNADGLPIAEAVQEDHPFAVVWTSGAQIVRVGTRATEAEALELAAQVDKTSGDVHVQRIGTPPSDEELTDAETKMTVDSEPETEAEIVAWLAGFGRYSDDGVPEDEKTAQLDARLTAIQGDSPGPEAGTDEEDPTPLPVPADPEPDLDADEPIAAETSLAEEPWEIKIAAELEQQTGVASFRWLVVDTDAGELIGRARVKSEAEELREKILEQPSADAASVEVVKTQAVLEKAEELQIERRREMIPAEEPTHVDATPADEPTPDPEPPAEDENPEEPEAKSPGAKGGGLFDASDFDREDLALPAVDGHSIDKIALDFTGRVMLDRGNPDHVALFRRAKIHADLELWIRGKGSGVIVKPNTNKDGDLDVVVSTRGLRVEAVRIVPAEELADLKDELGKQATDAHEAGEDR